MEICVSNYLLKKGYKVNTEALNLIKECDDWYSNRQIPEFHNRKTVQNVPYRAETDGLCEAVLQR